VPSRSTRSLGLMKGVPYLGASAACIATAEASLGVEFPKLLKRMWLTYNLVELQRGHWRVFPVFDQANPRKTSNDIAYENTKGRRLMPDGILGIAESMSGSGNRLVLRIVSGMAEEPVLLFEYRSGKLSKWKGGLGDFVAEAERSAKIVTRLASRDSHEA